MRLYRPTYTNRKTGAKKTSRVCRVRFSIDGRRFDVSTGCRDIAAARIRGRQIQAAEERRMVDPAGAAIADSRKVPIGRLVDEFCGELARRNRSARHVQDCRRLLRCAFEGIQDIGMATPQRMRAFLGQLQEQGVTENTANHYRTAVRAFFQWLVREERWPRNPMDSVAPSRIEAPAVRRRALTPGELSALDAAAPEERAICYLVAATGGLRRGELAALRVQDLDLSSSPTIVIRAASAKNRREAIQPIPPGTAERLRAWCTGRRPEDRVFGSIPKVALLHSDLEAAGVAPTTADGHVDFHALRVTYVTQLGRNGVPLAMVQRLARHSDPKLTSNIYTRFEIHDLHKAVSKIDQAATYPLTAPQERSNVHPGASSCSVRDDGETEENPLPEPQEADLRRFEEQGGLVAQLVEQRTHNPLLRLVFPRTYDRDLSIASIESMEC